MGQKFMNKDISNYSRSVNPQDGHGARSTSRPAPENADGLAERHGQSNLKRPRAFGACAVRSRALGEAQFRRCNGQLLLCRSGPGAVQGAFAPGTRQQSG